MEFVNRFWFSPGVEAATAVVVAGEAATRRGDVMKILPVLEAMVSDTQAIGAGALSETVYEHFGSTPELVDRNIGVESSSEAEFMEGDLISGPDTLWTGKQLADMAPMADAVASIDTRVSDARASVDNVFLDLDGDSSVETDLFDGTGELV